MPEAWVRNAFGMLSEWRDGTLSSFEHPGVAMSREREGVGDYFAYLLRLWREEGGEATRWRASVEDPHSGEKLGFAHLEELVAFLGERTGLAPPEERPKRERPSNIGSESEEGGSE
jgi:hypothetical protein